MRKYDLRLNEEYVLCGKNLKKIVAIKENLLFDEKQKIYISFITGNFDLKYVLRKSVVQQN